jgi:hypothetical protein
VCDHGGHLTDRGEPVAQTLAFFELLDPREVLEEHRGPDHVAVIGAYERQGVADHLVRRFEPHLDAVRQMVQIERAGKNPHHIRVIFQDRGNRLTDVVSLCGHAEDAIRLVVDESEPGIAGDGEHAIAHPGHDVSIERVARDSGSSGSTGTCAHLTLAGGTPSGSARTRLGHHR